MNHDTHAPAVEVEPLIGRIIAGKFRIDARIGEGSMGAVYRAEQVALEKTVALKIMHPELATDPTFAARFNREAKAASRLDHPNSIRILDHGQEPDGLLYIAMEYLDGRDLYTIVQQEWPLSNLRIVEILSQTLAALAVAHDQGILHRDLKPENIMVLKVKTDEGLDVEHVKVCDFGIASLIDGHDPETMVQGKVTTPGLVVGTPAYMSPEQARGGSLDLRSDVYAVGIILYELLTKRVPFTADTPLGVAVRQVSDTPALPSSLVRVDAKLEAVCMRAIGKAPADRYQSAREMRGALREALFDARGSHRRRTRLASDARISLHAPIRTEAPATQRKTLAAGVGTLAFLALLGSAFVWTARAHLRAPLAAASPTSAPTSKGITTAAVPEVTNALALELPPATTKPESLSPSSVPALPSAPAPRSSSLRDSGAAPSGDALKQVVDPVPSEYAIGAPAQAPSAIDALGATPAPTDLVKDTAATALEPLPAPILPPPGSAPGASAAPPADPRTARVEMAPAVNVLGDTSSSRVASAVRHIAGRLTVCYRKILPSLHAPSDVAGVLHIETDETGLVVNASLTGPDFAATMAPCAVAAAKTCTIEGVNTGSASADIPLFFKTR